MAAVTGREQEQQAIFDNVGQAVHVAFLIMAQEAAQDAPLRKALIRVMESVKLDSGNQRHWLDQLRGERGAGTVNFAGLAPGDIRAQCALITQAVTTNLPNVERWVLQAKYGETDFEDIVVGDRASDVLVAALTEAELKASKARAAVEQARQRFSKACDVPWVSLTRSARPAQPSEFQDAREALSSANHALAEAESGLQRARVALDHVAAPKLCDRGPAKEGQGQRRRWAFSAERIEAIKGLADWFAPMFPRIKPLALDCMLGRLYANHKKLDISARDLAAQFGGNHTQYLRASWKMKNHLRVLEEKALARLEPVFFEHGVTCRN